MDILNTYLSPDSSAHAKIEIIVAELENISVFEYKIHTLLHLFFHITTRKYVFF